MPHHSIYCSNLDAEFTWCASAHWWIRTMFRREKCAKQDAHDRQANRLTRDLANSMQLNGRATRRMPAWQRR